MVNFCENIKVNEIEYLLSKGCKPSDRSRPPSGGRRSGTFVQPNRWLSCNWQPKETDHVST
jgi:hypothetical protein